MKGIPEGLTVQFADLSITYCYIKQTVNILEQLQVTVGFSLAEKHSVYSKIDWKILYIPLNTNHGTPVFL